MMNVNEKINLFQKNGYVHLENYLEKDDCARLTNSLKTEIEMRGINDTQCPGSKSIRDSVVFDNLLIELLPYFENITGLKLLPTYAYARWYAPGEVLKIHSDRESCEISATVTLGFEGNPWPIFMGKFSEEPSREWRIDSNEDVIFIKDSSKITMNVGDAVVYRGREMLHWRDKYVEGKWQAQVFLHYVDANGPYQEWIYDKRGKLNLKKEENSSVGRVYQSVDDDLSTWMYTDILTDKDCEMLINLYNQAESEEAGIGKGTINREIRNVNRVILPVYKGIGARLAAAGLDANARRWNFDVKYANQAEFLKYPTGGGRYKGHIDTFLSKSPENQHECRKLTVLAFLNDDFKGGKFWIQTGEQKLYPVQKKGTVLIFPSFILHGVEDVEEGERYSVVTWLVGPWFK